MLKHSLLQPQMFFNSWFPQLAFPCLRRFIVLIIFHHVPHGWFTIEPLFIYFFITPKAQNTRTAQCKRPAVRHIGSSMLFGSAYKSWWSIYFPPLFTFFCNLHGASFLQSCAMVKIHVYQNNSLLILHVYSDFWTYPTSHCAVLQHFSQTSRRCH